MAYAQKIIDFYCYRCRGYELKTSPHYRAQKQRLARRRKAERAAEAEQEERAGVEQR
jgi:hypothetical protein